MLGKLVHRPISRPRKANKSPTLRVTRQSYAPRHRVEVSNLQQQRLLSGRYRNWVRFKCVVEFYVEKWGWTARAGTPPYPVRTSMDQTDAPRLSYLRVIGIYDENADDDLCLLSMCGEGLAIRT
jgi:hypothetical protein